MTEETGTRTRARARPQPVGEPRPTPIEDVPGQATPAPTPAPAPSPEPEPADDEADPTGYLVAGGTGRALPPLPDDAYPEGATPLADMRDDHPLSAPEALAEVFRRVRPIAKGRQAEPSAGGYRFRGIDDVYAELHDLFAEVGLVVLPSTLAREREQRARASGNGVNYVTHVHVRLTFLAQDGSTADLDGWGEGADTGDKSTGKAYSQAIKSALLAAFLIPTASSERDEPDLTNTPESRPFSVEEQQRASTALDAARRETTLDGLAGVGNRAYRGGLLDVPIVAPDGVVAPLRFHLDGLRRSLESRVPAGSS